MTEMTQTCQVNDCRRVPSTYCYCCNKNICTRHFTEHVDAARAQIDSLSDAINIMVEKVQDLTIEQLTKAPLEKLNQWKSEMHQLIDEIFSSKSNEIEELVQQNKEKFTEHKIRQLDNVMKVQEDIKQLVENGDVAFQQIKLLKKQLESIEENQANFQKNFIVIDIRVFDYGSVIVSSNLNKPSINPNVESSTSQFPRPTAVNVPIVFTFGSSVIQPFVLQTTNPGDSSNAGVFSFGNAPTTTGFNAPSFPSIATASTNNPFTIGDETMNRRPVIKQKRRVKP